MAVLGGLARVLRSTLVAKFVPPHARRLLQLPHAAFVGLQGDPPAVAFGEESDDSGDGTLSGRGELVPEGVGERHAGGLEASETVEGGGGGVGGPPEASEGSWRRPGRFLRYWSAHKQKPLVR